MRDLLRGELFYLKKDSITKGIYWLLVLASTVLVAYIGSLTKFRMDNFIEPVLTIAQLSIFLYFVIPIHACYFATEGFEYGTVKNIVASGKSRVWYVLGKYLLQLKLIISWLMLFFGLYYIIYLFGTLITGAEIGYSDIGNDLIKAVSIICLNFLYLSGYSAIIFMVGMIVRNTTSTAVITFGLIMGDFMLSGNLKDSESLFLRGLADNLMITQVMKFSGIFVSNGVKVTLASVTDYIYAILLPICIIVICLMISTISFTKRDIHA